MTTFNLRHAKLRTGEQFHDTVEVQLEPLVLGGQEYLPVPDRVPAELTITKATTGSVYELSFRARLHGPCFRCLRDTVNSGRNFLARFGRGEFVVPTPSFGSDPAWGPLLS